MTYAEKKEKEKYLLYLIEQQRLLNLRNIADEYNCSVRTIKRMLTNLRNEGYNICYCKARKRYYINK